MPETIALVFDKVDNTPTAIVCKRATSAETMPSPSDSAFHSLKLYLSLLVSGTIALVAGKGNDTPTAIKHNRASGAEMVSSPPDSAFHSYQTSSSSSKTAPSAFRISTSSSVDKKAVSPATIEMARNPPISVEGKLGVVRLNDWLARQSPRRKISWKFRQVTKSSMHGPQWKGTLFIGEKAILGPVRGQNKRLVKHQ